MKQEWSAAGRQREASMPEKNRLTANINGREYNLASSESREYMLSVADLVDQKMQQVQFANRQLNTTHVAVLAALNLAEEYMQLKASSESLSEENLAQARKIRELEGQLEKFKRNYR